MEKKIRVLDIAIDDYTAKEAMQQTMEYMQSEPVSLVRILTSGSLVKSAEIEAFKDHIEQFDMVIPGDVAVLETAGVTERIKLKEAENRMYLRMIMRYLNRQRKKVFLLADSEGELNRLREEIALNHRHIIVADYSVIEAGETADDKVVNKINGTEVDCVIAIMSSPLQEEFVLRNQALIDAKVWLALGMPFTPMGQENESWLSRFWVRRVLKKESEKLKKASFETAQEYGF